MKIKNTSPTVKKSTTPSSAMSAPARTSRLLLESLESRIAPAALTGINYIDVTLGTPQILKAGQGLKANGVYLMAVTAGQALVYTTDVNGSGNFDYNDITGISAGNGLKLTSFVNINGDIVTNLQADGTLSNSNGSNPAGHDGLLLLNSKIAAITLRSLTPSDVAPTDNYLSHLAPSTYSINGNIYAGGGVGDGIVGDGIVIDTVGTTAQVTKFNGVKTPYYQFAGVNPYIGSIKTGTAAGGNSFSFGYYATTTYYPTTITNPVPVVIHTAGDLQKGGTLQPYTPLVGAAGGDIIGISVGNGASTDATSNPSNPVPFTINGIVAGNGGIGAKGGSISNITLDGDTGGLRVQAGDGGSGSIGGAGGSITNLSDIGSVEGVVQIKTGSGGEGFLGAGGSAGTLTLGKFSMNGDIHINLGSGGNSLGNAGAGSSFPTGTLTPTDAGGVASAVSVVTTYRAAGDIGTPKMIDFNGDGFSDEVFMTQSPNQLGIVFGSATGITNTSPVLYLAVPGLISLDTNTSAITVGDFNNQYYPNGDPILDVAVASSVANNTNGISVFMNPGNDANGTSIWATDAASTNGGNFIDSSLHAVLPSLKGSITLPGNGGTLLASGGAITNLVTGDFNGDGKLDLAYTQQVYFNNTASIGSATTLAVLDGTGNGHFFANFDAGKTPYWNNGGLTHQAYSGQGNVTLKTTAIEAGVNTQSNPNPLEPDVLVIGGNGDVNGNETIGLIQNVAGNLQTQVLANPAYQTAVFHSGVITGFETLKGTPLDFAITTGITVPPSFTTPGGSDFFDVMVLDQGNNLSLFTGSYNTLSGTATMGLMGNSGVSLTGQDTIFGNNSHVDFKGIVAGSFGSVDATQFSLYSSGTGSTPTAFYQFDVVTTGMLHLDFGNNAYVAADLALKSIVAAPNAGSHYDGAIVAFDIYNNDATSTANATSFAPLITANTTFGYISAVPTSTALGLGAVDVGDGTLHNGAYYDGLIFGVGNYSVNGAAIQPVNVAHGLNNYAIEMIAGAGGNSDLGAGGAGGSIGNGVLGSVTVSLPVTEVDQPYVTLIGGTGGIGLTTGGNGGSLSGLTLQYVPAAGIFAGGFSLEAANGGAGFFGKGGNGGSLSKFQVQSGIHFTAGDGGTGYQGGNGGTIDGTSGLGGYSTYEGSIFLIAGMGASGVVSGGTGGNITGFAPLFPQPTGGANGGELFYTAGAGGNATAGVGGAGGSIINSSPISGTNYLGGPIIITAGIGGNGLTGGAGGSVSNFTNESTIGSKVSEVSIVAGNGGTGITGAGGVGGSISSVKASSGQSDLLYQFNRIIAGDGGVSYGGIGGAGGNLNTVNSTAGSTAEVLVAGKGGDGVTRGGLGGSVLNSYGNAANSTTSKLLVIAGAGGNASGALSTAVNVGDAGDTSAAIIALRAFGSSNGIGGNGGSITNFTQQAGTQVAVDLIAGNGGSLMNYGDSTTNTTNVGKGGSLSNISLAGTAGRIDSAVAIQTYGGAGTSVQDFVQNVLRDFPFVSLSDSGPFGGNVGVIVGAAGVQKATVPTNQGGNLPATDSIAKTGSVTTFSAGSIMSMIAGSVDRIAAINTLTNISLSDSNGVYGAYKNNPVGDQVSPIPHDINNPLYYKADGSETPTAVAGGSLMDGAIVSVTKSGTIVPSGVRVF